MLANIRISPIKILSIGYISIIGSCLLLTKLTLSYIKSKGILINYKNAVFKVLKRRKIAIAKSGRPYDESYVFVLPE
jgi:homospermidine synthase